MRRFTDQLRRLWLAVSKGTVLIDPETVESFATVMQSPANGVVLCGCLLDGKPTAAIGLVRPGPRGAMIVRPVFVALTADMELDLPDVTEQVFAGDLLEA
jgi:hypothetical protein